MKCIDCTWIHCTNKVFNDTIKDDACNTYVAYRQVSNAFKQINKDNKQLKEDIKFLLSLVPSWAKEAPIGLNAIMYGTLSQEGDQKIVDEVKAIIGRRNNE